MPVKHEQRKVIMSFTRPSMLQLLLLATLIAPTPATRAAPDDVFTIGGSPAQRAIVTAAWTDPPKADAPTSPMLREIAGIAAVLNARDIRDLNRALEPQTRVDRDLPSSQNAWTVYLAPRTNVTYSTSHAVTIRRAPEGWPFVESNGKQTRLATAAFDRISTDWITTRPDPRNLWRSFADTAIDNNSEPAASQPTPVPSRPSPIRLDTTTLSERFARDGPTPFAGVLTRSIDNESFALTLPQRPESRNPDSDLENEPETGPAPEPIASRPLGLLVWINPTPSAAAPREVLEAAAHHGLAVIVPAHAGNDRPVIDRLQIALDAVASARSVLWIDRERVYIAGMSGGGRLASMLWAGAPDVFTGAIGVVGINSHHAVPIGNGKVWPASHRIPGPPLAADLRRHPIAAISGTRDFNYTESKARIESLKRDGYHARLFDVPNLGHTMPDAETLTQALAWIDKAVTDSREQAAEEGQRLLDQISPDRLEQLPADMNPREHRLLERVTIIAPWTDPAWQAATLLGYTAEPSPSLTPSPGARQTPPAHAPDPPSDPRSALDTPPDPPLSSCSTAYTARGSPSPSPPPTPPPTPE